LGEAFFDALRPGTIFVNTSRAEVVDQKAMEKAISEKGIVCGLDVFEGEPAGAEGVYEGSLKDNPNVYCTHHIGASTDQAQEAIAAEVVRIVREYKTTGNAPNVVNVGKAEGATSLLVVRHLDRVGVLAEIFAILKDEGVNVQEMENVILGGARSAIAQISLDKAPSADALLKMKLSPNVLDASLLELHK
jgi:D-3-phosphoglycerate dehydrogenase